MAPLTPPLTRFAWLSVAAALTTIALKTGAYALTGSVGLLSDAMESGVNLAAAVGAVVSLSLAVRPADENFAFGYAKVEYFSSGAEGMMILAAAIGIAVAAIDRLLHPRALDAAWLGLGLSAVAAAVNGGVALVLRRAGKRHGSIVLEADASHLFVDVWTSAGVIAGVGLVWMTGWMWLDPVLAIAVAAQVVWTGVQLLRRSVAGLLDVALGPEERDLLRQVLDRYAAEGVAWHALLTRQAGARRFASVHILVPGAWTVAQGHDCLERIEADLRAAVPRLHMTTHLEPKEDPVSYEDGELDR
jgi:cation diffusion facilitator family transporter